MMLKFDIVIGRVASILLLNLFFLEFSGIDKLKKVKDYVRSNDDLDLNSIHNSLLSYVFSIIIVIPPCQEERTRYPIIDG